MLERTSEYYQREYIERQRSCLEIAEECNTYANKIRRELMKLGFPIRDKSEAQAIALKTGRHGHPTEGTHRNEDTKVKISEAMADNWDAVLPEERKRRSSLAQAQWESMSKVDKIEFQRAALVAVRETSTKGSQMEIFLCGALRQRGFEVLFHNDHVLPGTNLQTDLHVPSHKAVIEIDGPSHFSPVWGEERLKRTIIADKKKNEQLLNYGYVVIRIKHIAKTTSEIHKRQVAQRVIETLDRVKKNFPEPGARLIEIEVK